jgi:hypothetical protein
MRIEELDARQIRGLLLSDMIFSVDTFKRIEKRANELGVEVAKREGGGLSSLPNPQLRETGGFWKNNIIEELIYHEETTTD